MWARPGVACGQPVWGSSLVPDTRVPARPISKNSKLMKTVFVATCLYKAAQRSPFLRLAPS